MRKYIFARDVATLLLFCSTKNTEVTTGDSKRGVQLASHFILLHTFTTGAVYKYTVNNKLNLYVNSLEVQATSN